MNLSCAYGLNPLGLRRCVVSDSRFTLLLGPWKPCFQPPWKRLLVEGKEKPRHHRHQAGSWAGGSSTGCAPRRPSSLPPKPWGLQGLLSSRLPAPEWLALNHLLRFPFSDGTIIGIGWVSEVSPGSNGRKETRAGGAQRHSPGWGEDAEKAVFGGPVSARSSYNRKEDRKVKASDCTVRNHKRKRAD